MTGIFVDTSAWYALVDADDSDHEQAAAFFSANTTPLITTNATFSTVISLLHFTNLAQPFPLPPLAPAHQFCYKS